MTRSGRHFLQIPGPTNVPDRVLRAIGRPIVDHRGPEFAGLTHEVLERLRPIFQTSGPIVIFPSSGTGACEAALANTLSPGDRIVVIETGWFSEVPWRRVAERFGLTVEILPGTWRHAASAEQLADHLHADRQHAIKAVVVVHNETSTGITSNVAGLRRAMNDARHPALLVVDTVSSLASIEYRHDEWEVDVTVTGSQKGLMLAPGLGFNAVSEKAIAASARARLPRSYWDWRDVIKANEEGFFPYTPATSLMYGLHEAVQMLHEEGLPNVFARHARHAEATRAAVRAWGLDMVCEDPQAYSNTLTAVCLPQPYDADRVRASILEELDMSLGTGLGRLAGKVFRIGHLGAFNDLMLAGTLSGVEMGLRLAGVPHRPGGLDAALDYLTGSVTMRESVTNRR
jgi:alanine-glyoxylate transaminase/serine-glyoxylate transaminase/serine-pyruvate transaminase